MKLCYFFILLYLNKLCQKKNIIYSFWIFFVKLNCVVLLKRLGNTQWHVCHSLLLEVSFPSIPFLQNLTQISLSLSSHYPLLSLSLCEVCPCCRDSNPKYKHNIWITNTAEDKIESLGSSQSFICIISHLLYNKDFGILDGGKISYVINPSPHPS